MRPRVTRTITLAVALATVLTLTAMTTADVDLWGHIRFGLDILETGRIHVADSYSFTADRPWINHEWLAEVVIALAWRLGGATALIGLKLACIAAALALVAGILRETNVTGRARVMLLGLALAGMMPRVMQIRPQLFSVVLFAALIRIMVHSRRGSPVVLLWAIPILGLWANVHGGWLVGVATVGLWCVGEAWVRRGERRHVALVLACAFLGAAATLVNPYGIGLWRFLAETVRFGREAIAEWGPVWAEPTPLIVWICFAVLWIAGLRSRARTRGTGSGPDALATNPAAYLIPLIWGAAALRVSRLDAFFALSVLGFTTEPLAALFSRRHDSAPVRGRWQFAAVVLATILVSIAPASRRAITCIGMDPRRWPEPAVVAFMQQQNLEGRIVTFFNWGEYALWHAPRALKISMDGRRETVYTDRTIDRHLQLYWGTDTGVSYLDELQPDFVWLPRALPVVETLRARGWSVLFSGEQSMVLQRQRLTTPAAPDVGIRPAGIERCFPGP